MNKILVIGDIQLNQDDLYHVGDEASFNEVVRRLETKVKNVFISKFSEKTPDKDVSLRWIKSIVDFNQYPENLSRTLKQFDTIWFVGGGNLNSLYPQYLYHRVALMLIAKFLGVTIIVASQTIGPFNDEDRKIFHLGINGINYISIRDRIDSAYELEKLGIGYHVTHDDATNLFCKKARLTDKMKVGISLREWDSYSTVKKTRQILDCINKDIDIHLIPHLIDRNNSLDIGFMKKQFNGTAYDYEYFNNSNERFDIEVKSLTTSMDILITSRYHGAVFATSEGVKTIALYEGDYYRRKMQGLISLGILNLHVIDIEKDFDKKEVVDFIQKKQELHEPLILPNIKNILFSVKN